MARKCTGKNASGRPCGMAPLRGRRKCLAHSKAAKATAGAARQKGGRRRARQQQRAASERLEERAGWERIDSVSEVEEAAQKVFMQLVTGELGAKEAASAAKLLTLLRDGAERRERERLRKRSKPVKRRNIDGAAALEEAVGTFRDVVEEARADLGMSPEARRDQIIRAGAVLLKAVEPQRIIGELTDELRELVAITAGRGESNGVQEPPAGAPGGTQPPH